MNIIMQKKDLINLSIMRKNKFVSPFLPPNKRVSPRKQSPSNREYEAIVLKQSKLFFPINATKQHLPHQQNTNLNKQNLSKQIDSLYLISQEDKKHGNKDKHKKVKSKIKHHEKQTSNDKGIQYLQKPIIKYNTIQLKNMHGHLGGSGKTVYRSKNVKSLSKLDLQSNITHYTPNRDWKSGRNKNMRATSLKKTQSYLEYYDCQGADERSKINRTFSRDKKFYNPINQKKGKLLVRSQSDQFPQDQIVALLIQKEVYGIKFDNQQQYFL